MKKSMIALVATVALLGTGCSAANSPSNEEVAQVTSSASTSAVAGADISQRTGDAASRASVRETLDISKEMTQLKEMRAEVSIAYRGKKPVDLTVMKNKTVKEALEMADLKVGKNDKVSPDLDTQIKDGMEIKVTHTETKTWTEDWSVAVPETVYINDNSIAKGKSKVTRDAAKGLEKVTLSIKVVNGKEKGEAEVVDRKLIREAVAQQIALGTYVAPAPAPAPVQPKAQTQQRQAPAPQKSNPAPSQAPAPAPAPSGAGLNLANEGMWDRIAQCESSGNWSINTGNGYYGGLQFDYSTWLSVGGDDFAPRADLASRAQQITVANRLYAQRGLQPWGCAHAA